MPEEIKELAADKPAPEYQDMPNAYVAPEREEKTYEGGSDADAARDAAADLDDERRKRDGQEELPIIERAYVTYGTEEPRPDYETVDLARAAEDLTRQRDFEVSAQHQEIDQAVAAIADYNRGEPPQQPPEQQAQQQQQPQDEQAEFERALNNPKLRAALEQEVGKLEQSRSQYAAAAAQAFELSAAAVYSQFGELNGATFQTLPAIINAVNQNNPQRAQAMVRALQSTEQLHQASRQAQAAQAQIAQTCQAVWIKAEDAKFEFAIASEPKELVREIEREGLRILREAYNIEPQALFQLVQTNPGLRSAEAQRLLYDAIKTKLAAEKIAAKKVVPVPQVQRPGVSQPRPSYNDEQASSAHRAFLADPTPKSAAEFLQARRAAKQR